MNKLTAKIWARKEIAESTCEVEFQCDASGFDFKPGQYLEVIIPELLYSDTKGNNRNFSIVSIPNKEGIVSIVFRVSGSGFKRTLLELPIGSEVILRGPFGVFKLPEHTEKSIVFIAGGVGISPFMSMLKFINEQNIGLQVTILYANSNPDRAVYVEELEALTQQNANLELRLKYGYIDDAFIRHNLTKLSDKVWYVAGPPAFIRSMLYLLHELGIKNNDVFIEEMFGYDSGIGGFSYSVPIKQSNELSKIDASSVLSGDVLVSAILEVLSQTALVTITDTEGIIFYANEYLAQVSKYSSEEIIGQNNNILKSDYHSAAFYTDVWETIRKGKVWRGEIKNKAKDGSMYWVDSAISPIFGEKGQIINYIAIQFLITDKKNAEEELLAEKLILEQTIANMKEKSMELENIKIATFNILEDLDEEKKAVEKKVQERTLDLQNEKEKLLQVTKNMKEGAILFDSNTTPVFVNETCYQLFSIHQKDIELTTILNTVADYFMPNLVADLFQKCFDGNTFSVPEIEGRGKIYELNFQCLRDTEKADKIVGYFLSMFDITDRKLLERSKSELVSIASHQLRTPLTAMRGNLEMLIDESYGPMNEEQCELIEDMDVSTKRLIGMVNDMLDITKIERGKLDFAFEAVNVTEVISSICADLADYAKRRNFTISSKLPDDFMVYGDKLRIRQVFQNIIDNSIKYSQDNGTLAISCRTEDDFAEIILTDNGVGIPKFEQSKIFDRFYRATNITNSQSEGSGLGLYIVRSIVAQLGGDIWFESEENVGTTFFVALPTKKIILKKRQSKLSAI